jgi:hypothetical protein
MEIRRNSMGKVRNALPNVVMTPQMLSELQIISRKLKVAQEASNATGKDVNFYSAAINNVAYAEHEKDDWEKRFAEANDGKIPPNSNIDIATGSVYVETEE